MEIVSFKTQINFDEFLFLGPLHRAASQGHLDIIRLLLEQKGIRVDLTDREGNSALHASLDS